LIAAYRHESRIDPIAVVRLFEITKQRFKRPLTMKGLKHILKDWEKARGTPGDFVSPAAARHPRH
jgi:hypothetical protein